MECFRVHEAREAEQRPLELRGHELSMWALGNQTRQTSSIAAASGDCPDAQMVCEPSSLSET